MGPEHRKQKSADTRINRAQPRRLGKKLGRVLVRSARHPLLVLVIGSLVSIYLIPLIIARADEDKALNEARLKLAYEFSDRNTEFNSKNNAIATLIGEFHSQVQLDPGELKRYQADVRRDYLTRRMALDEMAWWWYGNLELRTNSLKLSDQHSAQLRGDFEQYGKSVVKSVDSLNELADYIRSEKFGTDAQREDNYATLWHKMWKIKSDEHEFRKTLVANIYKRLATEQ